MALKQPSEDNSLENFQRLSDDDYWGSAHKGFDFSEGSSQSSLSSVSLTLRKNDDLNQYDLLRYDGLNEVAENKTPSEELLTSHIYTAEEVKHAQKLVENLNPLELPLKVSKGNFEKKTLSAVETIRNIILGLEYNLTSFKGRREKIELMHAAVESHDGNAILVVVMFLKNTLKKSIFQKEIGLLPDAVNMYLSYLYEDHEIDELTNMLLLLNKPDDAAMLKYDFAILVQDPNRKMKIIENCLNTHFTCGSVHRFYQESVWEHKICLEDQIVLKDHKVSSEENSPTTAEIFTYLTGKTDLLDSSVTGNLIFSLLYFVNVAKIAFINAENLKARYKLSQKQYTWCALKTFAATKRWSNIEELFLSKSWLGKVKMRPCISYVQILGNLSKHKAPPEVMKTYINNFHKEDRKLFYAKKYKCYSVAIEILKKNRDRLGLIEIKGSLPRHSIEFCTITTILNENINWRN